MTTVRDALRAAGRRLDQARIERPAREAALLLRHLLGMTESALLARDREPLPPAIAADFERRIDLRVAGTPAAHLLGEREFWGRSFRVDHRVLVPRPETEHLVEIVLELPLVRSARVLDIGTGSGCVAITLAAERPDWRLVASDLSPAAIAVARVNAERLLPPGGIALACCDRAAAIRLDRFDLLVSNPPYVDRALAATLAPEVRDHDPALALFPPGDPLSMIELLLEDACGLAPGAHLVLEIGADQADQVADFATRLGAWDLLEVRQDWAGRDRNVVFRRRP